MPRIAAVADLHCHDNMRGQIAEALRDVNERADVLVLAGDVTATGRPSEAREMVKELRGVDVHYSLIRETLKGEPLDICPFMGNSELSKPIDRFGADVVFHGHSHYGSIYGHTDGGIPVFNVAQILVSSYYLYRMVEKHGAPGAAVSTKEEE